MNNSENILVIKSPVTNKYKEKGSIFIGLAERINSASEANDFLQKIRKKYYDATHHCYAYKTLTDEEKYSDDGEPNGTAGIRILNAIHHYNLTNILVVIVRYYGGTKLGVGPLGKAYSNTALSLLEGIEPIILTKYNKIEITYKYEDSSKIHYLLNKFNCKNISNGFDQNSPIITSFIEPINLKVFKYALNENTKGDAKIKIDTKPIFTSF
jgi:uncharacterized YigZ family protein